MGDMKDWVEDAAPLIDKQRSNYDGAFNREINNNEVLNSILGELKKLNSYMSMITDEEL